MFWTEELEQLLQEKTFDQLSFEEKTWLAAQKITEDDFRNYQHTLQESKRLFEATPLLSPSVKTALQKTFQEANHRPRLATRNLLIAASWAGFLMIGFLFGKEATAIETNVITQTIRDTIYLEQTSSAAAPIVLAEAPQKPANLVPETATVLSETRPPVEMQEAIYAAEIMPVAELPKIHSTKTKKKTDERLLELIVEVY